MDTKTSSAPPCVKRKWFRRRFLHPTRLGMCVHPDNVGVDDVSGKTRRRFDFASPVRGHLCNGAWFSTK